MGPWTRRDAHPPRRRGTEPSSLGRPAPEGLSGSRRFSAVGVLGSRPHGRFSHGACEPLALSTSKAARDRAPFRPSATSWESRRKDFRPGAKLGTRASEPLVQLEKVSPQSLKRRQEGTGPQVSVSVCHEVERPGDPATQGRAAVCSLAWLAQRFAQESPGRVHWTHITEALLMKRHLGSRMAPPAVKVRVGFRGDALYILNVTNVSDLNLPDSSEDRESPLKLNPASDTYKHANGGRTSPGAAVRCGFGNANPRFVCLRLESPGPGARPTPCPSPLPASEVGRRRPSRRGREARPEVGLRKR